MQAWDDLEKTVGLYHTRHSQYYIDHGVKIEYFPEENRFEIKNLMFSGDQYKDVTKAQYKVFETRGWLHGCYMTCIETYEGRIDRIRSSPTAPGSDRKVEAIRKKIARYLELQDKIH